MAHENYGLSTIFNSFSRINYFVLKNYFVSKSHFWFEKYFIKSSKKKINYGQIYRLRMFLLSRKVFNDFKKVTFIRILNFSNIYLVFLFSKNIRTTSYFFSVSKSNWKIKNKFKNKTALETIKSAVTRAYLFTKLKVNVT